MAAGYSKVVRGLIVDWIDGKGGTAPTVWNVGLSTANPADDYTGLAEPSSTGGYTRANQITAAGGGTGWTTAPTPANDAATIGANAVAVNFPTSSAAWSTGATTLTFFFISKNATLASGSGTVTDYLSRGAITAPQAVNASGITLSFGIGNLFLQITPV